MVNTAMHLPASLKLSYPVQRPYRLKHIHVWFYATAAVLTTLLCTLNVVLSGYDTVTVLSKDPNTAEYSYWWAPNGIPRSLRIRSRPGPCQEAKLDHDVPLKTNSSLALFPYYYVDSFPEGTEDIETYTFDQSMRYQANPLNSCRVQHMNIWMEPLKELIEVRIKLYCNQTRALSRNLRLSTTFSSQGNFNFHKHDTIMSYVFSNWAHTRLEGSYSSGDIFKKIGSDRAALENVVGVLDVLSADLHRVMKLIVQTWKHVLQCPTSNSEPFDLPPESAYVQWGSIIDWDNNEALLRSLPYRSTTYIYRDGKWLTKGCQPASFFQLFFQTAGNLLIAIRDATYIDLGYLTKDNIFINRAAFNAAIRSTEELHRLSEIYRQLLPNRTIDAVGSLTSGQLYDPNATWAQALTSTSLPVNNITIPVALESTDSPSVFSINYLCPIYQRKSWGSLLASVFVGTLSMCATAYSLFIWVAPILDRRYHGTSMIEELMSAGGPPRIRPSGEDDTLTLRSFPSSMHARLFEP